MQSRPAATTISLTDETYEVVPGVLFGRPEWVLSPAYWAALVESSAYDSVLFAEPGSLRDEVCFCLLGGYGIAAEVNCAAFEHLQQNGVFASKNVPSAEVIERHLRVPLRVGDRFIRYRFPRQRARRLSAALSYLDDSAAPSESAALREYLLSIEGIGPKTASWVARNWLGCDQVAILDVHVERAGRKIGLFNSNDRLPRDYFSMEKKFLDFADALGVPASVLDMAIWSTMRNLGRIAHA